MIEYIDWGTIEYAEAWDKQKVLFEQRVSAKAPGTVSTESFIDKAVFCEHPHVYTLGKSGVIENLLLNNNTLKEKGVSFFKTDRGGDITYHGPGQIVVYPIFDLEHFGIGLKQYIHKLEEAVIRTIAHFGVTGTRLEGATGVWLDTEIPGRTRKICAIGVKSSRFITMHGLALNINTDLNYFNYINPCGFTDKGVTSLQIETGETQSMDQCKEILFGNILDVFSDV
jgi:lipoyl(octanoyl) transferase